MYKTPEVRRQLIADMIGRKPVPTHHGAVLQPGVRQEDCCQEKERFK